MYIDERSFRKNESFDKNKRISVLGSTGSIGTQTLEVAEHMGLAIDTLTAGSDVKGLCEQCRKFSPRAAALSDENAAHELKALLSDTDIKVYGGKDGVVDAAGDMLSDTAIVAISGMAAAEPMIAAAHAVPRIGMANKEAIVAAGDLLLSSIKDAGAELIPIDSEHSAIFQCLKCAPDSNATYGGAGKRTLKRILLTASGGPFYGKTRKELEGVTPATALAHPTWRMGRKITIDSATLMNKGFEVIEAMRLFGVPADKIKVVVQRESIIHSMVELCDGAIIAQLAPPDMRCAIQYAITYPDRSPSLSGEVDFDALGAITFGSPDMETFPLLALAYDSAAKGGTYPAAMSAADEVAVGAFLLGKISFYGIYDIVLSVRDKTARTGDFSLDEIFEADTAARELAREMIYGK
ncbi:MAG: 1-deoxy-D-xylulose-5-phosphate reductoisomerase [Firmicutes bacterium]|nr:1-deoxy-D-xylulose-5-phosphate reductoisomerase [Bacillota bacterium]